MDKLKKICGKIFTVTNFLIVVVVVFAIFIVSIKINHNKRQEEYKEIIENGKDYIKEDTNNSDNNNVSDDNTSRYYSDTMRDIRTLNGTPETLGDKKKETCLSKAFDEGQINKTNVIGVMIGVDIDGKGIERYYFTDSDIIEKVLTRLESMKLTKMIDAGRTFGYGVEPDFDIQVCRADSEYAFRIYGESTNYNNYYMTEVDEVFNVGYYTAKDKLNNSYIETFGSRYQLLYDTEILSFINELIQDNVQVIDMETLLDICTADELDLGKLFGYKHTPPTYTVDLVWKSGSSLIYEFPIDGTEYRLLILREAFTGNGLPETDVQRLELYNGEGEYIDILTATEEEVRAFTK